MQVLLWYSQDPSALALLKKKQSSESLLERSLGQFQMFLRSLSKNKCELPLSPWLNGLWSLVNPSVQQTEEQREIASEVLSYSDTKVVSISDTEQRFMNNLWYINIPTWKRTETSMYLCLSSCSLKVAQMSEADATLTEQATGLWGGVALVQLRRFCIGAAHLGTARTCGECRSLSVPCMQHVSLCHSFTSSKIWIFVMPCPLQTF